MFVAHDKLTKERVTSIDPCWNDRVAELRERTRSERLVCPGCEQSLWLRTGTVRRRHFAHRQASECPLDNDSAEVLEVKAQLYEWLISKFPGKVSLDLDLAIRGWKKPADLVVSISPEQRFIYFVFDRQQRFRDALLDGRLRRKGTVHFIHTQSVRVLGEDRNELRLSASQRDFITRTIYDDSERWWVGGHLYFMDGTTSKLTIYRGLRCVHEPNLYAWNVVRNDLLKNALVSGKTGEIVFQADVDHRKALKEKAKKAAEKMEKNPWTPSESEDQDDDPDETEDSDETDDEETGMEPVEDLPLMVAEVKTAPIVPVEEEKPRLNLKGPFRCERCGAMTLDWSQASPWEGTCVCKNCIGIK